MSRRLGFLLLALCLPCAGCSGEAGTPPEQTASGDSTAEETLEEPKAAGDGETRAGWRRELREAQAMRRALRRDEALDAFDSIEARAEAAGEEVIALEAVLGQADVLREGGDTAGAIERLGDALARAESLDGTDRARWVAWVLRQRAQALSRGGDGAAAEIDLARAVELLSELGMEDEVAGVEATRSVLAAQTGRLREAVDFGRRALDRLGDGEPTAETLGALSAVAYGLHQLQHTDEALEAYDELIRKAWQRNDQHLLLFAYCNRAEILRTNGYFSESEADLRAAIERIEADRLHLPTGPDARSEALERQVAAYDRLIRLLVDSYRSDEAFAFTERFRGRAFLDLLAAAEASGHVPPTDSAPPDLEELHALLADDQALVSYWLLDDRLLAWVLVAGRAHFVQVPIAQDTLAATVADYLEELRSPALARTAALARTESEHLATGLDLHRQLVASLPHAAREARQLLVVSDGILHYLPLEALPVACDERPESKAPVDTEAPGQTLFAAYDSCRWLGLEQAVTHLPSAAVLVELRRRRRPAHEAARRSSWRPVPVQGGRSWQAPSARRTTSHRSWPAAAGSKARGRPRRCWRRPDAIDTCTSPPTAGFRTTSHFLRESSSRRTVTTTACCRQTRCSAST